MNGHDPLRCPDCRGQLEAAPGQLRCAACGACWPVVDGLPRLYRESAVRGSDRLMRFMYDRFAAWHDPAVTHLLPLADGSSEAALRNGYMRHIELGSLRGDARILYVSVGSGAGLPFVFRDLPPGLPVEIWGLDLSPRMIARCRRALRRRGETRVRLVMADAHALPFADRAFDRVFHIGGIGGFRDPRQALAEMARVSKPDVPIVVADEQLDPGRRHSLARRAAFRLITWFDGDPHCPRELLPAEARDVVEAQITRFYYCLRFKVPGARASSGS